MLQSYLNLSINILLLLNSEKIDLSVLISFLSIILITILSLLTLSLYKNNNIRLETNNRLHQKNGELIIAKEKAELEATEANKQLKKYTLIKIDKHLKTAINQYLSFFSTFVEESKKVSIKMHTMDSEDGLQISFDIPEQLDKNTLQEWFDDYLKYLYSNKNEINVKTAAGVTTEETDILILKLKSQINHYKRQLDILKIENSYLQDNSEFIKDIVKLLSSKSNQIFISSPNNQIHKQNNYSNQSQFIGSTINTDYFTISNIDEEIMNLIKESSIGISNQTELLNSIKITKDDSLPEEKRRKHGRLVRKFLETSVSESAKEILKFVIANSDSWLKYISNL
ncbi:hypothetical protein NO995_16405 [Aestuariibaculum sp. M13]|uniref:hypothetical protein n=1 Tax=Aestuariibaculum sp. M13 TaxID=2967132 RepID=UPI002159F597|nr:hypothetical protein [Aestuariibaculum sp. M13]MCR8669271.1 hypothetical protein [Aestuariibaculum sp. M13]